MPVKLFGLSGHPHTQQVILLLEQADMDYEFIEPTTSLMGYQVMFAVTGSRNPPVLCIDGKAFRGVEAAQSFFATR
jgi:hypothetical protein